MGFSSTTESTSQGSLSKKPSSKRMSRTDQDPSGEKPSANENIETENITSDTVGPTSAAKKQDIKRSGTEASKVSSTGKESSKSSLERKLLREKALKEKEAKKRQKDLEKVLSKKNQNAPVAPAPAPVASVSKHNDNAEKKVKAKKVVEIPGDVNKIDPLQNVRPPSPDHSPALGNSTILPPGDHVSGKQSGDSTLIDRSKDPFPYRHFTPLHPCANRLLAMKWDRDDRKKHIKKLAAVKPKVDNCAPKLYRHLQTKPKKHQMDQERQAEIHRNNRILLERMSNIMYMEAHDPEIHATRRFQVLTNAGPRARAREQIKISLENKKLFERLQAKQPDYNRYKLLDQHFKHLAHLQNISCYPQKYMDQQAEYLTRMKGRAKTTSGKLPKIAGATSAAVPSAPRPKTTDAKVVLVGGL